MTVHLVFNAHLDPVWLWPWQYGLDEALATCRSACDRLDANPELVFTRGEAWVYHQVERVDPELFGRIREHVENSRWEIVGGWWIQPDCNAPSGWAMDWQAELGREYFESRFGRFPRIAYNVDSFGHSAFLPGLLRRHGQDRYVMMRPQEHEMELPARIFRWRGCEDGPEVVVFRIARAYTVREITEEHVLASTEGLPEGVAHTMCFVGVGDHGGGPTEAQIAWCRERRDSLPGVRLEFSSPSRFFDAVEGAELPLVVGELQMHAVGCYSVYRPVKTAVREAEHRLRQVDSVKALETPSSNWLGLEEGAGGGGLQAKQNVCFAHFHDTLGGTCLPSAYPQILDQLGLAKAVADDQLQVAFRRKMLELPPDPRQRIVVWNASDLPFEGLVAHDPWLDWRRWEPGWTLADEKGNPIPYQRIRSEAMMQDLHDGMPSILFPVKLEPGEMRSLFIEESPGEPKYQPIVWFEGPPEPLLHFFRERSDTWSHGVDAYREDPLEISSWSRQRQVERGSVRATVHQECTLGDSRIDLLRSVDYIHGWIDWTLRVHWREQHKLLKLVLPGPFTEREDGIMGGSLVRALDGKERPVRDWVRTDRLSVVCPEVYAADATPERLRLTLLRSPMMAWHDPHPGYAMELRAFSDQGVHAFRFRFLGPVDAASLDRHAFGMQRPPLTADLTRGMRSV
ncbi:MAG TPA: glycoside hydrolase family 38 C-terminal domain-containing protein [Fimbriimonas sp.]